MRSNEQVIVVNEILNEVSKAFHSGVGIRTTELDLIADKVNLLTYQVKDIVKTLIDNGEIITMTEKNRSVYCWLAPKGSTQANKVVCKPWDL